MASSQQDSNAASSVERTARLTLRGKYYTLVLLENGEPIDKFKPLVIENDNNKIDKRLEWEGDDGIAIPGAKYGMVTKNSTFVFEEKRYLVKEDTPFDSPADGKKSFRFGSFVYC